MEFLSNTSYETILFSDIPKRDDLCCVLICINYGKWDSSVKSSYHWQIFRCRQLIFLEPELIASPAVEDNRIIYGIITKEFYKTGKLQRHLEKLNLTYVDPQPVSNVVYEACVRYTLVSRISPLWNQVDNCLIQGRDFLLATSVMNAIKFELITREGDMFLSVWPLRVRLPLIQKESVDLNQYNDNDQCVHVLPSLKKGRLISVSSEIPDSCPYKSYKELRRHWKNMYGYRLPETPDQLFFCSLSFNKMSSTVYTYPSLCVRQNSLVFLRHLDHMTLLKTFLSNVSAKLPTICGRPFAVDSHVIYAVPKLCHLNENFEQANLSRIPSEHIIPARESKSQSALQEGGLSFSQLPTKDVPEFETSLLPHKPNFSIPTNKYSVENKPIVKNQEKMIPIIFKHNISQSTATKLIKTIQGSRRPLQPLAVRPLQQHLICDNSYTGSLPKGSENKKPRTRPQVQPDVDVEALARRRDLARVNTATLVNWLRTNNVPCKVKDRKSHLVEKVMDYLHLPR